MKWVWRSAFAVVVLALIAVVALATWEPIYATPAKAPPPKTYHAEIVRDEWGVPHIYGKTDADVAFGVAMAHAEDDFFTLQDVVAMSRGRYGAIAGQDGGAVRLRLSPARRARHGAARISQAARRYARAVRSLCRRPQPICRGSSRRAEARQSVPGQRRGRGGRLRAATAVLFRPWQCHRPAGCWRGFAA